MASPPPYLAEAACQLGEYLAGERTAFTLPFTLAGSPFQLEVWGALLEVPFGATVTYGELAAWAGHRGCGRAVGQALGANPLPVVVPCHRVVPAGGAVGGFAAGPALKAALLAHEAAAARRG